MPIDFPANPVNGQVYEGFVYSSATSSWISSSSVDTLGERLSAIESRVPPGTLHQWIGASAPSGYLLCQGQAVSRTQFVDLFNAIGELYGVGDGSTTFNLPNLQGKIPVGKSSSGTFSTLNNTGGADAVTLTEAQMPVHTHTQDSHTHTQNSHNHTQDQHRHGLPGYLVTFQYYGQNTPIEGNAMNPSGQSTGSATATNNATTATNNATTATNQNTGGGQPHNNLQPYLVLNYIIKT